MNIPGDLSVETQKKICDHHVEHFKKLIELGNSDKPSARTVRVPECEDYLVAWTRGRLALESDQPLTNWCTNETVDALWSGDVDELLTPDELERWKKHMIDSEDAEESDRGET